MSVLVDYATRGQLDVLVVGVWAGVVLAAALLVQLHATPAWRLRRSIDRLEADNERLKTQLHNMTEAYRMAARDRNRWMLAYLAEHPDLHETTGRDS